MKYAFGEVDRLVSSSWSCLRREHDVFSAPGCRGGRNVQSVWYDIATVKAGMEPVDTLSKAFAVHTARVACRGPRMCACRGIVNTKPLVHSGGVQLTANTGW